jgi:Na+-exporting ATPase
VAVILLNIVVGFMQEFSAEKTMDSLRSLASPTANVVRDGGCVSIPNREVVPGDAVELKTGDTIPAVSMTFHINAARLTEIQDIRLIEAVNFEADEALLTGESLPVRKEANSTFGDETGPGDRLNIAYSSSTVTKGRARGIVFATGMYTEIGSIATALRSSGSKARVVKRQPDGTAKPHRYLEAWILTLGDALGRFLGVNVGTPLQKKLSRLAILLFGIAVVFAIVVLAANNFANKQEVIIYAVGTGLSMIPASLIVVLTITMSAGTKRMVERNVIVRNMKALEALGAVTDICSDKTGTITQGKMVAKKAWIPGKGTYSVGSSSEPFNPTVGNLSFNPLSPIEMESTEEESDGTIISPEDILETDEHLIEYLNIASLANLANVHKSEDGWHARGDPTEIAMQVFASRFNWNRSRWTTGQNPAWKQLAEFPFDSDVKRMSVLFENTESGEKTIFTKGAVERLLDACTSVHLKDGDEAVSLDDELRQRILDNMEAMAAHGLRVLALASRPLVHSLEANVEVDRAEFEKGLTFRGLIGLYDPPRLESAASIRQCQTAGITVHMVSCSQVILFSKHILTYATANRRSPRYGESNRSRSRHSTSQNARTEQRSHKRNGNDSITIRQTLRR